MSPGVRMMPEAMLLPMAAAMPNQMPRTWRSFPVRSEDVGVAAVGEFKVWAGRTSRVRHTNRDVRKCKLEVRLRRAGVRRGDFFRCAACPENATCPNGRIGGWRRNVFRRGRGRVAVA